MLTLETFKQHARRAIQKYEALFTGKKTMNAHRARDVLFLQYVLETDTSTTVEALMQKLETFLQTIKTGWWIFKTGNSRLKDNLSDVFSAYKNPLLRAAHESLNHMSESYNDLKETLKAIKLLHPETAPEKAAPKSKVIAIPTPKSAEHPARLWDSVSIQSSGRMSFFVPPGSEEDETDVVDAKPSLEVKESTSLK